MESTTLEFWKRLKESIYPELGISASIGKEEFPSLLVVSKIKEKKFFKDIINSPEEFLSPFNLFSEELQIQALPDTDYMGEKIKGFELKIPGRGEKIKIFLMFVDEYFLVNVGKDNAGIKKGYGTIKREEKNLNHLPHVLSMFESFPSNVSVKFYISPAQIFSLVTGKTFHAEGIGGVVYPCGNTIISEAKWRKELLSLFLSIPPPERD